MRLAALLLLVACTQEHDKPKPRPDPQPRRVIEPPNGTNVRALPPFAIQREAVGPYRLGEPLEKVLEELPTGPRIALFDIPGLVHRSLIRTEDDTVLVGGEPTSTASLIAVLGTEVARTENGVHVGTTRDELQKALGAPANDPDRARDPRLYVPAAQRNLRAILDGDAVAGLVLVNDVSPPSQSAPGLAVEVEGDDVRLGDAQAVRIPGLVFAAPLRNLVDGRDELVAVSRSEDAQQRTWTLHCFRLDGARLVRAIDPAPLYQLSSQNARWIGADLKDVELYLELASRTDSIDVSGLLTTRAAGRLHDVVTIAPIAVPRRHAVKPSDAVDAGVEPDAGSLGKGSGLRAN